MGMEQLSGYRGWQSPLLLGEGGSSLFGANTGTLSPNGHLQAMRPSCIAGAFSSKIVLWTVA